MNKIDEMQILNRYVNFLWFADMLIRRYATGKINLNCDLGLKINRIPNQREITLNLIVCQNVKKLFQVSNK